MSSHMIVVPQLKCWWYFLKVIPVTYPHALSCIATNHFIFLILILIYFLFLAVLHGTWDLCSWPKNQTHPNSGSTESFSVDHQGSPTTIPEHMLAALKTNALLPLTLPSLSDVFINLKEQFAQWNTWDPVVKVPHGGYLFPRNLEVDKAVC